MTLREAIELGILIREQRTDDKPTRLLTVDESFAVWHDPRRAKPYRYAPAEKPSKTDLAAGTAGGNYGGADSLIEALRTTVLLRSKVCR